MRVLLLTTRTRLPFAGLLNFTGHYNLAETVKETTHFFM